MIPAANHPLLRLVLLLGALQLLTAPLGLSQSTWRVSVDSAGAEAAGGSDVSSISKVGRWVAFESGASNLVVGDSNGLPDVFLHDRRTGTTIRVSVDSSGSEGDGLSSMPMVSADGRVVAFMSLASNLVPGDTNQQADIFVHDRVTGRTDRVSVASNGAEGDFGSPWASLSGDGQIVAFESSATNLVTGDTNLAPDIFVHDRATGLTTRVSVTSSGKEAKRDARFCRISWDGQLVAFQSLASLDPVDSNQDWDAYVHDRRTGLTQLVSVDPSGAAGNGGTVFPALSGDGRFVAFSSAASNLVATDTNGVDDVFIRDLTAQVTTLVSVDSSGLQGNDNSRWVTALSENGQIVVFDSWASNLVSNDTNGLYDVFRHDRATGRTERISVGSAGQEGDGWSFGYFRLGVTGDGRLTCFGSLATNLVSGDTNGAPDVFVHGPSLILEATPETVTAGASLTLDTWTGQPAGPTLLAVVDVNGSGGFFRVARGAFDAAGTWSLSGTVPASLAGSTVSFLAFGLAPTGKVESTNVEVVTITP